jgi:acetylornithine deacetylase/succinyl-diaminopimelate desuccinylase-like protein
MLKAGHAENALPQSATATANCRIFPGVPVSEAVNGRYPEVQLLAYMESGGTEL